MLDYLFEAHFSDGTMIQQTPEDVSVVDPTRSRFYDVAQRLDDVVAFGFFNDQHTYAVDLRDGHFEVDGAPFFSYPKDFAPSEETKFRLIYFRHHTHQITQGSDVEDHTVE